MRPTQLRTVADRRFDDANALRRTGQNARANGAMYLGGFVIECLLKAQLLERSGWLQTARSPEGRNKEDRHLWSLCFRSHDLDEILARLPEIELTDDEKQRKKVTEELVQMAKEQPGNVAQMVKMWLSEDRE